MERETNLMICPYNEQHFVHRARFQKHIIKCSKNYPPKYKETCPFNATHIMFRSELEEHIHSCPDKLGFTPEYYTFAKKHGALKVNTTTEYDEALTCDNNWDGDAEDRMKDFADSSSVASTVAESTCSSSKALANHPKPLRPPRGYGLTITMKFPEEDCRDEVESVVSTQSSLPPGGRGFRPAPMVTTRSTLTIGRGTGRKYM